MKQYQQKFQGGTLAVTWNYLRESMNSYLSQPNPVTARWESEDHLRDPNFQLDAFRVSIIFGFGSANQDHYSLADNGKRPGQDQDNLRPKETI